MRKRTRFSNLPALNKLRFEPDTEKVLYRQLYEALRQAILTGQIEVGARLPSTRTLVTDLALSRNTIINAFDQLIAEGYLESRVGDGTYVAHTLPDDLLQVSEADLTNRQLRQSASVRQVSPRGNLLSQTPAAVPRSRSSNAPTVSFRAGLPDYGSFPVAQWARLVNQLWKNPPPGLFTYEDPAGYLPLREAIAEYLHTARGVRCQPEQVLIVSGSQQALTLASLLLLDMGDPAWIEDPGYLGARAALQGTGTRLVPVPIDEEGLNLEAAIASEPNARLVYVTPSHQYPLGVTMSLSRRLTLLQWANRAEAWIIEDDYDSEFRYSSRPLAALQSLDQGKRIIYTGTFSKVMFPALRLGYMVVPPHLVNAFTSAKALMDRNSPLADQMVLARFMAEGHFFSHIRRMRTLYAARQAVLIQALNRYAPMIQVNRAHSGMQLIGWLPIDIDDKAASQAAAEQGVEITPLSVYRLSPAERGGLLFGYAALEDNVIREGIKRLAEGLHRIQANRSPVKGI